MANEGIQAVLEEQETLTAKLYTDGIGSSVALLTNISLPASAWVGEASPYSQVVQIAGITRRSLVDLQPSVEQLEEFQDMVLALTTENNEGVITVYAIGDKPTKDYVIQATVMEVVS